jgi:hypothetical protein
MNHELGRNGSETGPTLSGRKCLQVRRELQTADRNFPRSTKLRRRSQRAGQYDSIAFRITQPAFPVGILTAMGRFDNLGLQLRSPRDGAIEILQFKPKEHAIPVGPKAGIPQRAMLVFDVPIVQLEDQVSAEHQPLVIRSTVVALTAEETLIPPAACLDVVDANKGLQTHSSGKILYSR